jgi:hypothetical protein
VRGLPCSTRWTHGPTQRSAPRSLSLKPGIILAFLWLAFWIVWIVTVIAFFAILFTTR